LEEEKGFRLTGISMFGSFGIPLIVPKSHFFYSPLIKQLRLEDIIIHSILVADHHMMPILLIWRKNQSKIDSKYLQEQAEKYSAKDSVNGITAYFASEGLERAAGFPPWSEFLTKAKEYGLQ
jgi:hypothetical protein